NGRRADGGGGVCPSVRDRSGVGGGHRDGNGSGGPDGALPVIGLGGQCVDTCRQTGPGRSEGVNAGGGGAFAQAGGSIEEDHGIDALVVAGGGRDGGGIRRDVG